MRNNFRDFKIKRSCSEHHTDYKKYKDFLQKDFNSRCAYCNLSDKMVTTFFEIDHFVPHAVFKDICPEFETLYDNLMYVCKKCNMAKSKQYEGEISNKEIKNDLFYDPVVVDLNDIFYRDDIGSICSDDEKGRDIIGRMNLYRPIHNMAWICENTRKAYDSLIARIEIVGRDSETGIKLIKAKEKISDYLIECNTVFTENYNNTKFSLKE